MKNVAASIAGFLLVPTLTLWAGQSEDGERYWPQWRGPHATGVSPNGRPPVEWSESKNIRWKIEIPGKGASSPVVWGDQLYLTTTISTDRSVPLDSVPQPRVEGGFRHPAVSPATHFHKFVIISVDRVSGKILWQKTVREELPHEGTHEFGSFASMSVVTDGERIYAFFGSRGLYCFDTEGNLLWEKDFGDMVIRLGFGEGASPVLHDDKIVVLWDHEGPSFIVALNKETGEELWRTNRDEITSWATPLVVEHDGEVQVVTSATDRVRSYDLTSGKLIWQARGLTLNTIPSPVAAQGMVYVTSGFQGNALLAIQVSGASGDITNSEAIVWKLDRDTPYVPSPLLYGGILYLIKTNSNILSAHDAKTGRQYYQRRLEGLSGVFASPTGAAGHVYVAGRDGSTAVIKSGPEFQVLATNSLDEAFDASMAIADNEIYLRGSKYLYCILESN